MCPEPYGRTTGPIFKKLSKNSLTYVLGCALKFWPIRFHSDVMAVILLKKRCHCVRFCPGPLVIKTTGQVLTKLSNSLTLMLYCVKMLTVLLIW